MLPSWELQGGDQSPLLPIGVGTDWGLALEPYLILWPFLVSWSVPPMSLAGARLFGESEHWSEREPRLPSGGVPPRSSQTPLLQHNRATSQVAQGASMVGISLGPPEMLQKQVLEKLSPTLGKLENSGLLCLWAQRS